MTLKNTVGSLAQGAVSTAASAVRHPISTATTVVRHPISTASMAVGLVKGTAEAGVDLVWGVVRGTGQEDDTVQDRVQDKVEDHLEGQVDLPTQRQEPAGEPAAAKPAATENLDVPREPQVVPKPVPAIDELPEPIVIVADDSPGEAIHTEPKAASRDSEHGGQPGDREEAEGYVEEIPSEIAGAISEDPVVWTSESTGAPTPADLNRPI